MDAARTPAPHMLTVQGESDLARVRRAARELAGRLGFSELERVRVVTAVSELVTNALVHAGGGEVRLELLRPAPLGGLQVTVEDGGPGISDLERALQDGFSTAGSLGLGLGGARRLADELEIAPRGGGGLRVVLRQWRGPSPRRSG